MHRRLGLLALCLGMLAAHHAAAEEIQIGGIVQLPGGAPLAEIEVLLFPLLDPLNEARTVMDPAPPEPVARALTNAKGRFRLVAPHAGLWSVRVAAAGFVPEEAVLQPLIEEVELPPLELSSDVGMTVRAVDEQVRPVAGARVFLRSEGSRFRFQRSTWSPPLRSGQTDDDGTVQLPRGERERVTSRCAAASPASSRFERATESPSRGCFSHSVPVPTRSAGPTPTGGSRRRSIARSLPR
jgi:hypothetical protein